PGVRRRARRVRRLGALSERQPLRPRLPMTDGRSDAHRAFVESLSGERIGGRYVVERVLGRGGMGLVAEARYPELEQRVAIKFMWPEHAANSVLNARFLREARVAAQVHGPHLV